MAGSERTVDALTDRLSRYPDLALHEVRLDLLDHPSHAFDLASRFPILFTCRSRSQGGAFQGTEHERRRILERALGADPLYLDVEFSEDTSHLRELVKSRGSTRVIASHHALDLSWKHGLPRGFSDAPADLLKLAVSVEDVADLRDLLELTSSLHRPTIRIAMGSAGRLSRSLSYNLGSPLNFVAPDEAPGTAPGQLTLSEAKAFRSDVPGLTPLGLLGGPNVAKSPGPRVYNALFEENRLPFVYTTLETHRPIEAIELAESIGFRGLSVTMPHKAAVMSAVTELRPPARLIGAINTILLDGPNRIGLNTDTPAIQALLAPYRDRHALILGAGGAARAAVVALRSLGCSVELTARDEARLAAATQALGARPLPWANRHASEFEILVNATPASDPVPGVSSWAGRVVLDAVLTETPTELVQTARRGGAIVFNGLAWWRAQGQAQLSAILEAAGLPVPTIPPLEDHS
ncbi:MAG: type I 3-dehydroquinate dehydratase [Deltaproteobacteria bacterium]|nr:type I 3-dehydroquinate dehydratase [Deltaproteobacteria bacterium]